MALTVVYANDSKVSMNLEPLHVENQGNNLHPVVKNFKSMPIHDNMSIDIHKIEHELIVPIEEVVVNESIVNESAVSDNDNSTIGDDSVHDDSVENVSEPVVESRNLVTVVAYPSAIGDLNSYSYAPYLVTWDMGVLNSLYGTCNYNWKQTFEGEWSVVASGPYNDVDFSGLTGVEKVQSGKSGNYFKDVSSAIVDVKRCYGYTGAQVVG
jgi:hypothetical protein